MPVPDTLNAVASLASMTERDYVFLLFKLGGVAVAGLVGILSFVVAFLKAFDVVWTRIMERLKQDLNKVFVTKEDFDAFEERVDNRLNEGTQEMRNLSRRIDRSFVLAGLGSDAFRADLANDSSQSDFSSHHPGGV